MSNFPAGTVTFLFTDVVASSQLWESDPATMETAMAIHDRIIKSSISAHDGVFVKGTGDGAFAVFASAFDAVEAAASIQLALEEESWSPESTIEVRIGLHTGEAELRDDDYFGSTVNRTARVMSAASAGEVLLSLTTQEVVRDRLRSDLTLNDVGEQDLKGFTRPEHVFSLSSGRDGASRTDHESRAPTNKHLPVSARRAAWIAVLPFDNIGGDAEQNYFADGITGDIITALAAWQTLRVISRTSSFHYRDTGATLDEIANELGVSYILEGSVRRAGQRIRVTAQLIETKTKHHVWAEKYDGAVADIFDVQDKITQSIVGAIFPAIRGSETRRATRDRPESLDAWDYLLLGRAETDKFRSEGNRRAIEYLNAALAIDPDYSSAHTYLAFAHFVDGWINATESREQSAEVAHTEALRAIELDDRDAMAHAILAYTDLLLGRLSAMAASATRAIELNPSLAYGHHGLGIALSYRGDHAEGLRFIEQAIALEPHSPGMNFYLGNKALAHLLLGDWNQAVDAARQAIGLKYGYIFGRVLLISALGHMGDAENARMEVDALLDITPDFSAALLDPYPLLDVDRALIDDGIRKAGLIE